MIATNAQLKDFAEYLRRCTDAQVQGVYNKETAAKRPQYAALAAREAERRGIELDE